ncbi:MAG: phosphoglycerate kinase [Patescibacteria group bacterium]
MMLKKYTSRDVKTGGRILMRIDANVPVANGKVQEGSNGRLAKTIPEIKKLAQRKAKVILMSHFGRPNGKPDSKYSLQPVVSQLSKLLGKKIKLAPAVIGSEVVTMVERMKPGEVIMLENLRFHSGEQRNNAKFAKELARLGDVYINSAFGVCHRKDASVNAITKYLPSFAGELVFEEIKQLSKPFAKPFILVMAGVKLETKVGILNKLAPKASAVLVGGGMSITLLSAKYQKALRIGGQKIPHAEFVLAKKLLDKFGERIYCPLDYKIAKTDKPKKLDEKMIKEVGPKDFIFDIGSHTEELYRRVLQTANSVVWNGPMGIIENPKSIHGTEFIAKVISDLQDARTIVGGGDTVAFIDQQGLGKGFDLLSTGGGAMLAYLAGEAMPGLEPLWED